MAWDNTIAFVNQYSANVIALAQQQPSKFRNAVRVKDGVVGKATHFERIGPTAAQKRTSRLGDTPLMNTPQSRVKCTLDTYDWADLVADDDEVRELINPTSEYAQNGAKAMNRSIDDIVIAAITAAMTLVDESDATSTSSLPGGNSIANGSTNLTVAKLRQAARIMNVGDVDASDRYLAISPIGLEALLKTTEVTSSDFNTVKALVDGTLNTFLGFNIFWSTRLAISGNIRSCLAWQKNAVALAIGRDVKNMVEPRYDKNGATQVRLEFVMGATRVDNAGVVKIDIDETA